jgi:hypothetical protein
VFSVAAGTVTHALWLEMATVSSCLHHRLTCAAAAGEVGVDCRIYLGLPSAAGCSWMQWIVLHAFGFNCFSL